MSTNGASDETIAAYAAQLLDLEADLEAMQGAKKDVYANARETYGKRFADSLKLAIKRHRMDADKRDAADEIDVEAERMLAIISKPSAPRATRAREIIEEFDPETGEIKPAGNGASGAEEETQVATVRAPSSANSSLAKAAHAVSRATANAERQPQAETGKAGDGEPGRQDSAFADADPAPIPPPAEGNTPTSAGHGDESATHAAALVVADNVVPIKKRPTFSDPAHRDCLDPTRCGGLSNLKLCQRCAEAAEGGQVA
jgi:hypothetical protein